jgi:hypothetical protein
VSLISDGRILVAGDAGGELLNAVVGLSFWAAWILKRGSSSISITLCATSAWPAGCSRSRAAVDRAPEAECCLN